MPHPSLLTFYLALGLGLCHALPSEESGFSDSTQVFSQLSEKGKAMLRKAIQYKLVSRAKIMSLDLKEVKNIRSLNMDLFDHGSSSFQVIRLDSNRETNSYSLRLKGPSGRIALLVVRRHSVVGKIYPDLYGDDPNAYDIFSAGEGKQLLMEVNPGAANGLEDEPPRRRNFIPGQKMEPK